MCGIAGEYAYRPESSEVSLQNVELMAQHMIARGPDAEGSWLSPDSRVALAHRRLAVIDTSLSAQQPFFGKSGMLTLVYNGEIYNFQALRSRLESRGHTFKTKSDTEVLLALYEEYGVEMLSLLRGMFAFGIWDSEKRELVLARDPFGIKPLYFSDDGRRVLFASQVKALLQCSGIDTSFDPAGHVGFYVFGSIPEPFTLYSKISMLPAGSFLRVANGRVESPKQFSSLLDFVGGCGPQDNNGVDGVQSLREVLKDSVQHHLISDVPIGLFFSAGLDSTTLASLAASMSSGQVKTATLQFDPLLNTPLDEGPLAEKCAKLIGTDHRSSIVHKSDFAQELNNFFDAMDQPSIDGINTYFVSKAAKETGLTVALSGIGGDELFGGYPSFCQIPPLAKFRFPSGVGSPIRSLIAPLISRVTSPKYASILEYCGDYRKAYLLRRGLFLPWELEQFLDSNTVRDGWGAIESSLFSLPLPQEVPEHVVVSYLEMSLYMRNQLLRDADWAGMAHSLEIRVPYVDVEVVRHVSKLHSYHKAVSKRELSVACAPMLPDEVRDAQKRGFVVPVRAWLIEDSGKVDRGLRNWAHFVYDRFVN
ncbi:MAG: asparagine synthase (glutamine-hydrolyzing) [Bdellovibrionales bacterium]|nr:asparagine synthase (glutamine-hydrolyzing) [Bdellovibrionales bacterium]